MTVVAICDPSDTTVAAFAGPAGAWLRRPTDLEPALWEQDPQYKQYQYIYIYIYSIFYAHPASTRLPQHRKYYSAGRTRDGKRQAVFALTIQLRAQDLMASAAGPEFFREAP